MTINQHLSHPYINLNSLLEFAKEAMTCQSLDFKEILSIRWAKDDPNPVAQNSISMADKDALASFLNARGVNIDESAFNGPLDYTNPEPKRIKLNDVDVLGEYPELAYPDTDGQYAVSGGQHDMNSSAVQGTGTGIGVVDARAGVVVGSEFPTSNRTLGDSTVIPIMPILPIASVGESDYTAFFASLGGSYTASTSSSSAAGNHDVTGVVIKQTVDQGDCQSLLGDLLDKKRLLQGLALDCYLDNDENEGSQCNDAPTSFSEGGIRDVVTTQIREEEVVNQDKVRVEVGHEDEGDDDDEDNEEWTAHIDPESGATYYYNSSTGESSWGTAPTT